MVKDKAAKDKYESIRLGNQLCFPLYACSKEVIRQYRKPLEEFGLTYTQYLVMMVLWEFGGMTEGEIGKRIHLDSGTLAPLLKRLEKQGYINRERPDNHERKLFISLTETGKSMEKEALKIPQAMNGCIQLEEDELFMLKSLLDKALGRMSTEK